MYRAGYKKYVHLTFWGQAADLGRSGGSGRSQHRIKNAINDFL